MRCNAMKTVTYQTIKTPAGEMQEVLPMAELEALRDALDGG